MLVVMVVRTLERYAEWAALEASSLEISVSYTLGALYVPDGSTSPFVLSHFPPQPISIVCLPQFNFEETILLALDIALYKGGSSSKVGAETIQSYACFGNFLSFQLH